MRVTSKHVVIKAPTVEAAKAYINEHDPSYFGGYEGNCYLINDNTPMWQHTIANPRKVRSTLIDEDVLGFHVLAEVKNHKIWNRETLFKWFERSLAQIQIPIRNTIVESVLEKMFEWKMLNEQDNGVFKITRLGLVSATLYYFPSDVHHWAKGFSIMSMNDLWDSDLCLSYVLGTTPTMDLGYVPRADADDVADYTSHLREVWPYAGLKQSVIAYRLYELLAQGEKSFQVRNMQNDIERISQALTWINGIRFWNQAAYWRALPIRIRYGIGRELVALCELPGIGAVRAKRLSTEGINSLQDVIDNPRQMVSLLGRTTGDKAVTVARNLKRQQQEEE